MSNSATFNFSTNQTFPQGDLYVDTNSWMDMGLSRPHGQATQQYLTNYVSQNIPQNNTPIIVWSPQNRTELMEGIEYDVYSHELSRFGVSKNFLKNSPNYVNTRNQIHSNVQTKANAILQPFMNSIYEIEYSSKVNKIAEEIMTRYGVQWKDAIHLAYMWIEQINNLLTRDRGFENVPGLNLYSPQIANNGNRPFPITDFMPDLPSSLKD